MHTRPGVVLAVVLTGFLLVTGFVTDLASAAVLAKSTFDSDTNGWTAVRVDLVGSLPGSVSFAGGSGNPGGAVRHDAPSDSRTSYLVAPSSIVNALHSISNLDTGGLISGPMDFTKVGQPSTKTVYVSEADKNAVNKVLKKDDFNRYSIKCVGKHVTIKVNDVTTVDQEFEKMPADGIIAFQLHAGAAMEVTFRNIRFRDLSKK